MSEETRKTNKETAQHFRDYAANTHGVFSWPADACGYDQSISFSDYRNENYTGNSQEDFKKFLIAYVEMLEKKKDWVFGELCIGKHREDRWCHDNKNKAGYCHECWCPVNDKKNSNV